MGIQSNWNQEVIAKKGVARKPLSLMLVDIQLFALTSEWTTVRAGIYSFPMSPEASMETPCGRRHISIENAIVHAEQNLGTYPKPAGPNRGRTRLDDDGAAHRIKTLPIPSV